MSAETLYTWWPAILLWLVLHIVGVIIFIKKRKSKKEASRRNTLTNASSPSIK